VNHDLFNGKNLGYLFFNFYILTSILSFKDYNKHERKNLLEKHLLNVYYPSNKSL